LTLTEPVAWYGTLLKGDVVEEVRKLKEQPGEDILIYGSGWLVNTLHPHGLIDAYRLMVFPVTLGEGAHLFRKASGARNLKLVDTNTASTGVAMLTYEHA
jgi:dihydrofolate reductase